MMADDGGIRVSDDDIMVEILLLLPAKSLAQCKSVCKTWYNFIKTPNFIANYINHNHNHNRLLAISYQWIGYKRDNVDYSINFCSILNESLSVSKIITDNPIISNCLPFTKIDEIIGPVNGLYCIRWYFSRCKQYSDYEEFIALWNPFTTEFRQLEYPSFLGITSGRFGVIGFGSTDDDIKLVCITSDTDDTDGEDFYTVVLYSLGKDCWRKIKSDIYLGLFQFGSLQSSAYSNGFCYWMIDESSRNVFVFDMRAEVFRSILPYEYRDRVNIMLARNDCLVFLNVEWSGDSDRRRFVNSFDVFEMKEEGCLNKIYSFLLPYEDSRPLLFWKDEIIFQAFDINDKLLSYNISSTQIRELEIDADFRIFDCKVSLTSVKGGTGLMQVL